MRSLGPRHMRPEQREARPFVMQSQICTAHYSSGNRFLSPTALPQRGPCSVLLARFTPPDRFYYLSTSENVPRSGRETKVTSFSGRSYDSTGLSIVAWPIVLCSI